MFYRTNVFVCVVLVCSLVTGCTDKEIKLGAGLAIVTFSKLKKEDKGNVDLSSKDSGQTWAEQRVLNFMNVRNQGSDLPNPHIKAEKLTYNSERQEQGYWVGALMQTHHNTRLAEKRISNRESEYVVTKAEHWTVFTEYFWVPDGIGENRQPIKRWLTPEKPFKPWSDEEMVAEATKLDAQIDDTKSPTPGVKVGVVHYNQHKGEDGLWVAEKRRIYVEPVYGAKELPDGRTILFESAPGYYEQITKFHWQRSNR